MKNNKGVGTDDISAEVTKYGGNAVPDWYQLCNLTQMTCCDKEITEDWGKAMFDHNTEERLICWIVQIT